MEQMYAGRRLVSRCRAWLRKADPDDFGPTARVQVYGVRQTSSGDDPTLGAVEEADLSLALSRLPAMLRDVGRWIREHRRARGWGAELSTYLHEHHYGEWLTYLATPYACLDERCQLRTRRHRSARCSHPVQALIDATASGIASTLGDEWAAT